jgi:hypothetical protein
LPPAYEPSQGIVPGYAGDNTPPPKPKGVMDTSFTSLPSTANPDGGSEWERVGNAAYDAWKNSPNVLTPFGEQQVDRWLPGGIGSGLVTPLTKLLGAGIGGASALGAGVGQGVTDVARSLGVPERAIRDIPFLSGAVTSVLPQLGEASGYARTAPPPASPVSPLFRSPDAGPRYAPPQVAPGGGMTPMDVQRVQDAQAARQPPGMPLQRPFVPSSQTDIEPPIAPPPPEGLSPAQALARDKAIRDQWYQRVDQNAGSTVTPDYNNSSIDAAIKKLQPAGPRSAATADPALGKLAIDLNAARDQPITLGDYAASDRDLTGRIQQQRGPGGNPNTARIMQGVQADMRQSYENAGADNLVGGQDGFDALDPARQAHTQVAKQEALTDMAYKASLRGSAGGNEAGSMRNQLVNYLGSDESSNLTPMERAAVQRGIEMGPLATTLGAVKHIASPIVGGLLGGMQGALTAEGTRTGLGMWSNAIAKARVQDAINVISRGMPKPPPPLSLPTGQP